MHEIKTVGMRFVDALGRERIFHGMNLKAGGSKDAVNKMLGLLDEDFFRRSAELGFNVLRLGIAWDDLEPEKGKPNEALLLRVDEIFALAGRYGVYIFLDMHQDLYASFGVENGHGMPGWATLSDGIRRAPKPRLVWAEGYFWSRAVHRAFDHFWENAPTLGKGLQDHFAEHWQLLAKRYADSPAFLGFDFLNEPFPGKDGGKVFRKIVGKLVRVVAVSPSVHRVAFIRNVLGKETRPRAALDAVSSKVLRKVTSAGDALVRKFDLERYTPFIAKMTAAVREVTSKGVVFMETSYWGNVGIPYSARGPEGESVCFSPHGYDLTVDTPAYAFASDDRVGAIFAEHRRAQERMQVPVLVGEWGAGYMGEKCFPHIAFLAGRFDEYKWSFAYFTYTEGMYDKEEAQILVRPYPVAVNGTIQSYKYDAETGVFTLAFTQAEDLNPMLPTEIYLSRAAKAVEAEGFEWREEGIGDGPGRMLLLFGGGAGEHNIAIQLTTE